MKKNLKSRGIDDVITRQWSWERLPPEQGNPLKNGHFRPKTKLPKIVPRLSRARLGMPTGPETRATMPYDLVPAPSDLRGRAAAPSDRSEDGTAMARLLKSCEIMENDVFSGENESSPISLVHLGVNVAR